MQGLLDDYTPLIALACIVLAPAAVTVFILLVRRPDHPRPRREPHGFPVTTIDPTSPSSLPSARK